MQVEYKARGSEMKRDMDLIRSLLIAIESDPRFDGSVLIRPDEKDNLGIVGVTDHSLEEIDYHLMMLIEDG